jgi:iron complex transport system ATP-binding protein
LAQEPELLLLDEPTANLDLNYQIDFLELAEKLSRERGVTVIAAIHDLNLAAQFFNQFILVADKKIIAAGTPAQVLTSKNIQQAYGVNAVVQTNPLHGKLSITVLRRSGIAMSTGGSSTAP